MMQFFSAFCRAFARRNPVVPASRPALLFWLLALGGGVAASARQPVNAAFAGTAQTPAAGTNPDAPRKLYQVLTKDFHVNKLRPQTRALYQAFLHSWDAQSFSPNFREGLYSQAYPDKINIYGIRGSKTYQNYIKAFLEEGIQDPRLIEMVYQMVMPILPRFETGNALWPDIPLPGAAKTINGVLTVTDKWSDDYNKPYGVDKGKRSAYMRRHAWGYPGDDEWGNNPTVEERKSELYKKLEAENKDSGRKRLLFITPWSDYTGMKMWGTNRHQLDQQLGTQHLFWTGYILDVNRHLDPRYGKAADELWDYKMNHWEKDAPEVMGERHPVYKFYSKPSMLHHSNDAHASLFHANVVWHTLREGKPRPGDVTALKYLVQTILDDIHLIPVPKEAPEYEKFKGSKIANYCHWNNATHQLLGQKTKYLPGDMTYSQERAGTLVSLIHGKVTGTSGKQITGAYMEGLSNLYALIVEQGRPANGIWSIPNECSGFNKAGLQQETTVLFNNGQKASGFQYGGSAPPDLLAKDGGNPSGGFYLSWDTRGRHLAMFAERGKNHQFTDKRFDVTQVLQNPKDGMNKQWGWLTSYLLLSLKRPDIDLTALPGAPAPLNRIGKQ